MASKSIILFFIAMAAATLLSSTAQQIHVVGGGSGWVVPPSGAVAYTTWASQQTCTVGDVLVFNFTTGVHNVVEVSEAAYDACNSQSFVLLATKGPANINLTKAGEHFYFCTIARHCQLGMKLAINVSAASTATPARQPSPSVTAPAPAPAPSPSTTPTTYVVGDGLGWSVPPSDPKVYQTWASNKTFFVGDALVFNFTTGAHNVAQLTSKTDYDSCNTSAASTPITNSPARITLTTPGEHFYVCTFPQHCSFGQKLAIHVSGTAAAPSPSSTVTPPPPSPDTSSPPSPSSASSVAVAALPITLLSIAIALFS